MHRKWKESITETLVNCILKEKFYMAHKITYFHNSFDRLKDTCSVLSNLCFKKLLNIWFN